MIVWAKTEEFSEGKFLVTRRDGTTPDWPHFVMGARDPAVPAALRAYAQAADREGLKREFCDSVIVLASDFEAYRKLKGTGDPDAPPHRTDDPAVLALMRHELSVADLLWSYRRLRAAVEEIYSAGRDGPAIAKDVLKETWEPPAPLLEPQR